MRNIVLRTALTIHVRVAATIIASSGSSATATGSAVTVDLLIEVPVTGVSATAAVGTVTVVNKTNVHPVGVYATGYVGRVLIWEEIVPSQTPNWIPVVDAQTPGWTDIPT